MQHSVPCHLKAAQTLMSMHGTEHVTFFMVRRRAAGLEWRTGQTCGDHLLIGTSTPWAPVLLYIAALYNTFKLHVRVIEGAAVALLPEVPADQ
jgi:hypothetical protein